MTNNTMDLKSIKQTVAQAKELDKEICAILESRKQEVIDIKNAAEAHYNEKFREVLECISVDEMARSKKGITVEYLKKAGITNMYMLSEMNYSQIRHIEGIGPKNAKLINNYKKNLIEEMKDDVSMRLDSNNPSDSEASLIRAVCILLCHDDIRKEVKLLYNAYHDELVKQIAIAEEVETEIKWFFTSKSKKEKIIHATGVIKKRLETTLKDNSLLHAFHLVSEADERVYIKHFKAFTPSYYATIEKHCKRFTAKQKAKAEASSEFVKEIDSQRIRLKNLNIMLRKYQVFGVKYILHQRRVLLGDEMGLGKTIQAIAAMVSLKNSGRNRFIVVCPTSVLINWVKEIRKISKLDVIEIHGADQKSADLWLKNGGVAVTTFDSLSRVNLTACCSIDMVVVDEAHYVKNPKAQRTAEVLKLLRISEYALYMTGTPLINDIDEMTFLVNSLQPELGKKLFVEGKNTLPASLYRSELVPVYLRRLAKDVAKELPELISVNQWCNLNHEEYDLYKASVIEGNFTNIRRVSWNINDLGRSSKAASLIDICDKALLQNKRVIVYSFFLDTLRKVESLFADRWVKIIDGSVDPLKRQEIVDEFFQTPTGSILACQVKTGGTGLNIQAASVVVFCEPQLTPALEEQAFKRAHRIGQSDDVVVYKLIAADTVDERILDILAKKKEQFDSFADKSVADDMYKDYCKNHSQSVITAAIEEERARLEKE